MFGGLAIVPGILELFVWVLAALASLTLLRRSKAAMALLLGAASCFFLRTGLQVVLTAALFALTPRFVYADLVFAVVSGGLSALLHALEMALLAAAVLVDRAPAPGRRDPPPRGGVAKR